MKANLANRPSVERVRELLTYEPDTGILRWRVTLGSRAVARFEAGGIDKSTGYHRVRIDGCLILSHHAAFALMTGRWPMQLDHVHGKDVGNGWWNLRESTQSQNIANTGKPSTNQSGFKGVSWHKDTGRWQAQIRVNKKTFYLGVYFTKEEAAEAYAAAAIEHFGEFARTEDMPRRRPIYKPQ